MKESLLESIKETVARQMGLQINKNENSRLEREILRRMKALDLTAVEDFCKVLECQDNSETQRLIQGFINSETYFFRDKGQFRLIRNWIFPELFKQKSLRRSLRIWSAGCSSGEEVYSLAILADELVSKADIDGWDIRIFGTDINKKAIEEAKRGVYSKHSFRGVDVSIIERYFNRTGGDWEVDERIKNKVMFYEGNLVNGYLGIPEAEYGNIDLILCRNVFIYFNPNTISLAVSRITDTLRKDGYFFTGHSELFGQDLKELKLIVFPESVFYRKTARFEVEEPKIKLRSVVLRTVDAEKIKVSSLPRKIKPEEIQALVDKNEASEAIKKLKQIINDDPFNSEAHCLLAGIQANLGKYEEAIGSCKNAIKINAFNAQPYYLLAQIAREKEQTAEEEAQLKKVIYLDSAHIPAYLELGNIYERKSTPIRALKMRETALQLLKSLPVETRIAPYTDLTAEALIVYLNKLIYNQ